MTLTRFAGDLYRRRMVLRASVAAWVFLAVTAASFAAKAESAEVESLIATGNDLRRAGSPGDALPYFRKANELARTARTVGQLGLAELAAGYPVEAAQHLATALESPSDPAIAKYRKALVEALVSARAQIGELAVQGGPTGAEILVNGSVAGSLPLSAPIKLAAGNVEIVVRSPGCLERKYSVRIAGGRHQELTANLERIEPSPTPAPVAVVAASSAPPSADTPALTQKAVGAVAPGRPSARTAAWIVIGGAAVAAGAGLTLNLGARNTLSEFNAACANLPTGIVQIPGEPLSSDACGDRYDAWNSYRRWSIAGYAAGAALAVTSGVLFWMSRPVSASGGEVRAALTCAPGLSGLTCQGLF